MVVADIIIVVLVALSAYRGYKKGLVKTLSKLCCLVVSVIVAKWLYPVISVYVMESSLGDFISERISAQTTSAFEGLPLFFQEAGNNTANGIANSVVSVVTILLIIIITYFASKLIVSALNIVAKFPVISMFNRFMGMIAGFFIGVFIVYLLIFVLVIADVQGVQKWIEDSVIAYTMYRENILMKFIL